MERVLRIAQDIVGFLDVFEAVFGGFIAGVEIGMIFARELPVGLADIVFRGGALYPERFIVVVFWLSGHMEMGAGGY